MTRDRSRLLFTDYVSNTATLLRVNATTERKSLTVGRGPVASFLINDDRHGVTLDSKARSITVLDIKQMERVTTLMLDGVPRDGATSPDRKTLFVSLGGDSWPPRAKGAAVIAGDPPKVVANIDTGRGASRIAVAPSGRRAVVANYLDKTLTVISSE